MARIRSVHPGLFTDESFVSVSMPARMLAIGIWTECDDQGAFAWKPITLKMKLMAADAVDVAALMEELRAAGIVMSYDVGGKRYGLVRNFCKYQRPKKPNSVYPIPADLKAYAGYHADADANVLHSPSTTLETKNCHSRAGGEPVGNWFSTGGEKSPQMEDGGWRKNLGAEPHGALMTPGNDDAPASNLPGHFLPSTPTARLFADGLPILVKLTGKSASAARTILGKLKKAAGDDCDLVIAVLHAGEKAQPVDPVAWLVSAIRVRATSAASRAREADFIDRCGIAGWIATLQDAKYDPDASAPELRRWTANGYYVDFIADELAEAARLPAEWRGNWNTLTQWLQDGIEPEKIRRAIEFIAARPGYIPPRSIAYFDKAVRKAGAQHESSISTNPKTQ